MNDYQIRKRTLQHICFHGSINSQKATICCSASTMRQAVSSLLQNTATVSVWQTHINNLGLSFNMDCSYTQ